MAELRCRLVWPRGPAVQQRPGRRGWLCRDAATAPPSHSPALPQGPVHSKTFSLYRDLLELGINPPEVFCLPLHLPVPGKHLCSKMDLSHYGQDKGDSQGRDRAQAALHTRN